MSKKNTKKKKGFLIGLIKVLAVFICALLLLIEITSFICRNYPGEKADYKSLTNHHITEDKALVSAHRSGKDIAPENTMAAFKYCIESEDFNVDVFEFDLHITKDNQLILLHDSTLDRTTDSEAVFGEKNIKPSEKTYEELRQLNFGVNFALPSGEYPYKDLKGDAVPDDLRAVLLEDVIDYLEENGDFGYIIEIKDGGELGFASADELYRILEERDVLDKVVFGTFNGDVTAYVDENYPDMLRSSSILETIGFYLDASFGIKRADGYYKFEALQIPHSGYGLFELASERVVNYAHRNNIAVQYWTVNEAEDVKALNDIGADCIMSDAPDMAYDVINR